MNADSPLSVPSGAANSGAADPGAATPRAMPWGEVLLGMLLFVVLGVGAVLFNLPRPPGGPAVPLNSAYAIAGLIFLFGWLLILVAVGFAWQRGFPRWSMPYLFFGAIFTLYMFNVATPGVTLFGVPIWGRQAWGFRACVPVFLLVLVGLWLGRSRGNPFRQLGDHVRGDWTYLSFGVFAFLPLLLPIIMDEMDHDFTLWPTVAAVSTMVLFAALYLIFAHKPYRAVFLMAGMFLSVLAANIGSTYYWKTHDIDIETNIRTPLPGPVPWGEIINASWSGALIWTFILALPGLIALVGYLLKRGGRKSA